MDRNAMLSPRLKGLLYGFLGVTGFSLTPPMTRLAVSDLDPSFVGLGRAVLAAMIAGLLLYLFKAPRPQRQQLRSLSVVAACVVLLFPLLSSWSLHYLSASHTGVVLGILPLATALVSTIRHGERPSVLFWFISLCGAVTVLIFSLRHGGGAIQSGDVILFVAVIAAAIGYSEGAQLAKTISGWQVICWALLIALPVLIVPTFIIAWPMNFDVPLSAWLGFLYLALGSQLLIFFPWYQGLALGGTARVSQLMLLMPFMTLFSSQYLLGDQVSVDTWLFAIAILVIVFISKYLTVNKKPT